MESDMDINLDQKNIKLWVQKNNVKISVKLLDEFSDNFIKNESSFLCQELINNWRSFVDDCSYNKMPTAIITLPQNISKYLPNNTNSSGLYCIFGKHVNYQGPLCFYVGMSASSQSMGHSSSIKQRLFLHLKNNCDPKGKYGTEGFKQCFYWLRQCSELFICWAEAETNDKDLGLKYKLECLEMCLAVKLQALFLLGRHLQNSLFF
jgi:hypothetical protein